MGMDVEGRCPTDDTGVYFRANIWSWRPLHELIYKLGGDIIDAKTMDMMANNDGAGPRSNVICHKLADRFEIWLEHNANGCMLEAGCHVLAGTGQFATDEQVEDMSVKTESAHSICDDHIKEFVEFLRTCGGFQVF